MLEGERSVPCAVCSSGRRWRCAAWERAGAAGTCAAAVVCRDRAEEGRDTSGAAPGGGRAAAVVGTSCRAAGRWWAEGACATASEEVRRILYDLGQLGIDVPEAVEAGMHRWRAGATTAAGAGEPSATARWAAAAEGRRWRVGSRASARSWSGGGAAATDAACRQCVEGTLGVFEEGPRVPREPVFRRVSSPAARRESRTKSRAAWEGGCCRAEEASRQCRQARSWGCAAICL